MLKILLRPRWLLAHLLVVTIAVTFVSLGLWQLRRLEERRDRNAVVAQRVAAPQQALGVVLETHGNDPEALPYRRVTARGRYLREGELLLTPRSRDGQAGHHVLTPLLLDDGSAILVERGWVPFAHDRPPVGAAAPPQGEVTVEGLLMPTRTATRSGAFSGADRLEFMSVADTDLAQAEVDAPLLPLTILLQRQEPPADGLPFIPPAPDLSEGPHLSYALQWFAFTLVGLVGYPLLVRRRLRQERGDDDPAHAPAEKAASGAR